MDIWQIYYHQISIFSRLLHAQASCYYKYINAYSSLKSAWHVYTRDLIYTKLTNNIHKKYISLRILKYFCLVLELENEKKIFTTVFIRTRAYKQIITFLLILICGWKLYIKKKRNSTQASVRT